MLHLTTKPNQSRPRSVIALFLTIALLLNPAPLPASALAPRFTQTSVPLSRIPSLIVEGFWGPWIPAATALDQDGSVHMVVEARGPDGAGIYYLRALGERVLAVDKLSSGPGLAHHPDILLTKGVLYVVWQSDSSGENQIYCRRRVGGVWSVAVQVSKSLDGASNPRLVPQDAVGVRIEWSEMLGGQNGVCSCTWSQDACAEIGVQTEPAPRPALVDTSAAEGERVIAYLRDGDIWAIRENGTDDKALTYSGTVTAFAWSPNGQEIAYLAYNADYQADVYVMNADGSNVRRLTTNSRASRWVVDWRGSRIAFIHDTDTTPMIKIAYVDTSDPSHTIVDVSPEIENWGVGFGITSWPKLGWSPDGQWIALAHGGAVGVAAVDGSTFYPVWLNDPAWKNDSSHLVYTAPDGSSGISTFAPQSNHYGQLSTAPAHVAVYSGDDAAVAYATEYYLRRMNANNTDHTSLIYGRTADPAWSPNNDRIAYASWGYVDGWDTYTGLHTIGTDASGWLQLVAGYAHHPLWQPQTEDCLSTLIGQINLFAENSSTRLGEIEYEALALAQDGDFFAVQKSEDEIQLVADAIIDSVGLLAGPVPSIEKTKNAVKMQMPGVIGQGWGHILRAKQQYEPARDAFRAAMMKPLTQANARLAVKEFLGAAHTYYAADFLDQAAESLITDGMIKYGWQIGLQSELALQTRLYPRLEQLGDTLLQDMMNTAMETNAGLSCMSESEQSAYVADLQKRSVANVAMSYTLQRRGLPVHLARSARQSAQDSWVTEFLLKYALTAAVAILADGPGVLLVEGSDTLYNLYRNVSDLREDAQMMTIAVEGLSGALDTQRRIYANSVHALEMIASRTPPQIADCVVPWISNYSLGEYKVLGGLWWWERDSYSQVLIDNVTEYDTVFQAIADYSNTGFLGTDYQPLVGEGIAELAGYQSGSALVRYRQGDLGVSPDEDSYINVNILGSTDSGTYWVLNTGTYWQPARITSEGQRAALPASAQTDDAIATIPYPIRSRVDVLADSLRYRPHLWIDNPFAESVDIVVTQPLPEGVQVLDPNGGSIIGRSLVWSQAVDPNSTIEITYLIRYDGMAGVPMDYPPATLEMANQTESATFASDPAVFWVQTPLVGSSQPPVRLYAGETTSIFVTIANRASDWVAGTAHLVLLDEDGTEVSRAYQDLYVAPSAELALALPLHAPASIGTYVLQAVVDSGGGSAEISISYLDIVHSPQAYLPLLMRSQTPTGTRTSSPTPSMTPTATPSLFVWDQEAEQGSLTAPMTMRSDSSASACYYVSSPEYGVGNVSFSFQVNEAGDYYVWARTRGIDFTRNSFYVSVDGGSEFHYEIPQAGTVWDWSWNPVHVVDQPVEPIYLAPGTHTLQIRAREADARLDRVLVTNSASYVPSAITPCSTPTATESAPLTPTPTVTPLEIIWQQEAEDGTLTAPMAVTSDNQASAGAYISSPENNNGAVSFTFSVPSSQGYYLWARSMGTGYTHNSFYVSMDGGGESVYEIPQAGASWDWSWNPVHPVDQAVTPISLSAGSHTLQFRGREPGARLDVVLLTDSASFTPSGSSPCP